MFGFDDDEIAGAVGKSAATVRQVAHRAREHVHVHVHVHAGRKRFQPLDTAQTTKLTEQFTTAASTGDLDGLLAMLAPDATWTADGGGKVTAARRPVVGAKKVAVVLMSIFRLAQKLPGVRIHSVRCNNAPAIVVCLGDHLELALLMEVIDDKVANLYAIRNPDKLAAITVPRTISR